MTTGLTYRANLPCGIRDRADHCWSENARTLVRDGVQRVESRLETRGNELSKETTAVRGQAAHDKAVDRTQGIHLPGLLETKHP